MKNIYKVKFNFNVQYETEDATSINVVETIEFLVAAENAGEVTLNSAYQQFLRIGSDDPESLFGNCDDAIMLIPPEIELVKANDGRIF